MLEVTIERAALATMLASTREVFSNETYGLLLGKKSKNVVDVLHAVPYQVAKRTRGEVNCNGKTRKKLSEILESFTNKNFKVLGDFHSHPVLRNQTFSEYSELSEGDYDAMVTDEVYALVVAKLRNSKRYTLRYAKKAHEIAGQWCDIYFTLKVYAWYDAENRYSLTPIKCRGINIKRK